MHRICVQHLQIYKSLFIFRFYLIQNYFCIEIIMILCMYVALFYNQKSRKKGILKKETIKSIFRCNLGQVAAEFMSTQLGNQKVKLVESTTRKKILFLSCVEERIQKSVNIDKSECFFSMQFTVVKHMYYNQGRTAKAEGE